MMSLVYCVVLTLFVSTVTAAPPSLPAHVPISECRNLMDLVLVIDGSDSISSQDYQKQRMALAHMIEGLDLGPNKARVGIVVYSSGIAQVIPISDDRKLLISEASNLIHPRDGTKTSLGIAKMIEMFKLQGRAKVPWASIVITDGQSKNPPQTSIQAGEAKKMGINMYAVGISHFILRSELEAIASDPSQVLTLTSFDHLRPSLSNIMKVVCPCTIPPPILNGGATPGSRKIGTRRIYVCDPGYQGMGNPEIVCLKTAIWSALEFSCVACPNPMPEYGNALILPGDNLIGSIRQYECSKGFASPEPLLITCVETPQGPQWTNPKFKCAGCLDPPSVLNAYLDTSIMDTYVGVSRHYICNPGFISTGPIDTTCVLDLGVTGWTAPVHSCISCGLPPSIQYADIDATGGSLVNDIRVYTCHAGFHPTGPIEAICMGEKGATFWKTTGHKCIACKPPPKVRDAVLLEQGNNLIGSVRTYICVKGYQPTGPIEVLCKVINGVPIWEGPIHGCNDCPEPPIIMNAIIDTTGNTQLAAVRYYTCMAGFIQTGPIAVGCVEGPGGPVWTPPEHTCVMCEAPPTFPHAILDTMQGDNHVGSKRFYRCEQGYEIAIAGGFHIECIGEYVNDKGRAFWSPPSGSCVVSGCGAAPIIPHAEVEAYPGDFIVGTILSYRCLTGFFPTGPIEVMCTDTRQWTAPKHGCEVICGPPPDVMYADVTPGSNAIGSVRTYVCLKGYMPNAQPKVKCMKGAVWSTVEFACIKCKEPYGLKYAVLEPGDSHIGAIRRYTCIPGYLATGPITTTCTVPMGKNFPDWSTPVHYCKDCGDPYVVRNADILPADKTIGAIQAYRCFKGFIPSGPPNIHCMQNGEWTPPNFKCLGRQHVMTCSTLPLP